MNNGSSVRELKRSLLLVISLGYLLFNYPQKSVDNSADFIVY